VTFAICPHLQTDLDINSKQFNHLPFQTEFGQLLAFFTQAGLGARRFATEHTRFQHRLEIKRRPLRFKAGRRNLNAKRCSNTAYTG